MTPRQLRAEANRLERAINAIRASVTFPVEKYVGGREAFLQIGKTINRLRQEADKLTKQEAGNE